MSVYNEPFSPAETARIREMADAGKGPAEIARDLGRARSSVRGRLRRLGFGAATEKTCAVCGATFDVAPDKTHVSVCGETCRLVRRREQARARARRGRDERLAAAAAGGDKRPLSAGEVHRPAPKRGASLPATGMPRETRPTGEVGRLRWVMQVLRPVAPVFPARVVDPTAAPDVWLFAGRRLTEDELVAAAEQAVARRARAA